MNKIQEVMYKFRSGSESEKGNVGAALSGGDASSERKGDEAEAATDQGDTPSPHDTSADSFTHINLPTTTAAAVVASTSASATDSFNMTEFNTGSSSNSGSGSSSAATVTTATSLASAATSTTGGVAVKCPLEKRLSKQKPKGTFEYTVEDRDTLIKIGAHFDVTPSELMKVNKMMSRNVFPGQTLFIPDPNYVPSPPTTPTASPPATSPVDSRPKVDVPYVEMADRPMPAVPGHAVKVKTTSSAGAPTKKSVVRQPSREELDEADQECMKRFLKTPVRRFVENVEADGTEGGVIPCKGTLLLTPNALMFDPDVSDPLVMSCSNQSKYQLVVYMEDLKSAAIVTEYPKQKSSPAKAETYRGDNNGSSSSVSPSDGLGGSKVEKTDGESSQETGRTSEELEKMGEMAQRAPDLPIQPGRASEEIEHAMAGGGSIQSPATLHKQMSRSSEAASCEISQLGATSDVFGETRDFGPHLGRSSSEVHRQLAATNSSGSGRLSVSSPSVGGGGEVIATISGGSGRSESTSEGALCTPTQGFAPVHFTDRSPPNNVIAHPTPVPGQRASMTGGSEPVVTESSPSSTTLAPNQTSQPSQQLILSPSSLSGLADAQGRVPLSSATGSALSQTSSSIGGSYSKTPAGDSLSTLTSSTGSDSMQQTQKQIPLGGDKALDPSANPQDVVAKEGLISSFSPSQQISNFFQFTSSFIRGAAGGQITQDKKSPTNTALSSPSVKVTPPGQAMKIKSECTKEEIERVLDHSADAFHQKPEGPCCFTEKPYYLQLRPGIPCDRPMDAAPRAFDYRNEGGYLEEYWFAVPKNIGTRLYDFLMTWRPEVYGDKEEKAPREKFFYDQREVRQILLARQSSQASSQGQTKAEEAESEGATSKPRTTSTASDLSYLHLTEDHFSDQEKAWVIIHHSAVNLPENEEEESVDEANMPELVGGSSNILNGQRLKDLYKAVPRQVSVGYNYELVYATHRDGFSLLNLYGKMAEFPESPVWLLIRDNHKCMFGAYLSESIKESKNFYGSGYTFLFSWYPHFRHFHWQGDNDFYMNGQREYFSVGSGDGQFGLWLDGDLYRGRSQECKTFRNPVLSKNEDFCIVDLEVWRFTDLM